MAAAAIVLAPAALLAVADGFYRRCPADRRRCTNIGLTLVQRLRRWTNVKITLFQRLLSAEWLPCVLNAVVRGTAEKSSDLCVLLFC